MGFLIFLITIIVLIWLSSPSVKGRLGERTVKRILNNLDQERYICIHDIMLRMPDGRTTQIDHVIISIFGIFILEVKNYKGWITGSEGSQYWNQIIFKRKERFYNPIRQNAGHVKALREYLEGYSDLPVIPIVVFTTRADLKIDVKSEVVYTHHLLHTIDKYRDFVLSRNDIQNIATLITKGNIEDKNARRDHVTSVQIKKGEQRSKLENRLCPYCGSELVVRSSKYGDFLGCTSFPKCRFKSKVG